MEVFLVGSLKTTVQNLRASTMGDWLVVSMPEMFLQWGMFCWCFIPSSLRQPRPRFERREERS